MAFANIAEFFGASATTMGIANQSNFNPGDPANNIYNASILANSEDNSFSFNQYAIDTNFKSIDNIIGTSPINSGEAADQSGSVDTNYETQYLNSIHGSFAFKA